MRRREARRQVFHLLYQIEVGRWSPQEALDAFLASHQAGEEEVNFVVEMVSGVVDHLKELDEHIQAHSPEWPVERMPCTDRNLLRIATYEMLYRQDIPHPVTVNEAVVLAKRYGTEDSGRFVNGVLGAVLRECEGEANPPAE